MPTIRFLTLLALVSIVASCGNGDDGEGDALAAAFADAARDDNSFGATEEEAQCLGDAVVDVVGVEQLEKSVTPAEVRKKPDADFEELGIDLDEDQASDLADEALGCVDGAEILARSLAQETDAKVDDETIECVRGAYDEDRFRELLRVSFLSGDEALDGSKDVAELFADVSECVTDESGNSFLVSALAEGLRGDSDLTEQQAECIATEVVDTIGEERFVELGASQAGGNLEDLPPDVRADMVQAITSALPKCDVTLDQLQR